MAFDLKQLYAERAQKSGFAFRPCEEAMAEFEAAFEYEETPDQLSSVAEIKADMCSNKVMDRLLCGDVGYGKTEVAFRAAYLCILNGKQAALMCPNTVLCQQHYETAQNALPTSASTSKCSTASRRRASRTRSSPASRRAGSTSSSAPTACSPPTSNSSDLGLLILDEEQRFGVEHKEKIKNMKRTWTA